MQFKVFLATSMLLISSFSFSQVTDLIISEYGEGSSNNKYIELYNGTAASVDLADYQIWKITNGGDWPEYTLNLEGELLSGETYVIGHTLFEFAPEISSLSINGTLTGFLNFNGDDAIGLAKLSGSEFSLIDAIGEAGADPGSGWTVGGVSNATKDHTLIRIAEYCNPNADWGTAVEEWAVFDQNYWENIGIHTGCLDIPVDL
jgi:predicted extracellular nuclease